jgi:hypothetical protein
MGNNMNRILLIICSIIFVGAFTACADVRVKTHHGWMGPSTWEATDGKISVSYYNGNCCCVAEQVLKNLAEKANRHELDWRQMADPKFREDALANECKKLQSK